MDLTRDPKRQDTYLPTQRKRFGFLAENTCDLRSCVGVTKF